MRVRSKKNLEFAHVYVMGLADDCVRRESEKAEIEIRLEQALRQIVFTTTAELLGDNEDPEEILERFI
jgi:hypothetical protein